MRRIKRGSTDQSVVIRIVDSTDGTPEEGVTFETAGIALWYRREGATVTAITEVTLATTDAAHSDGGVIHLDDGYYRIDLPDAAVAAAAGVNGVLVGGTVTGMIVIGCYIELTAYDPYDTVRAGLTALPNAAADAAGGLPISDAGALDLDTRISAAGMAAAIWNAVRASYGTEGTFGEVSTVAQIVTAVLAGTVDGTGGNVITLSAAIAQILAGATGNIEKTGDAYAFKNRDGSTLFTLTMAAATRTRS